MLTIFLYPKHRRGTYHSRGQLDISIRFICFSIRKNMGKNEKMGVSGRICLYVACYDFVLGLNVSSLSLMFYVVGVLGLFYL